MGRLPRSPGLDRAPLYAPLLRLLDGLNVDANTVADRYGVTTNTLSTARRTGKSFPWFRVPTGGIRYPVAGLVSIELQQHGRVTLDNVKLVLLSDPNLTESQKAALSARLDTAFSTG